MKTQQQKATPEDLVARKRAEMPAVYRSIFDRAMAGNSKRAAIKAYCLECVGWQRVEVTRCSCPACPLYPYRPYRTGDEELDDGPEVEIEVEP